MEYYSKRLFRETGEVHGSPADAAAAALKQMGVPDSMNMRPMKSVRNSQPRFWNSPSEPSSFGGYDPSPAPVPTPAPAPVKKPRPEKDDSFYGRALSGQRTPRGSKPQYQPTPEETQEIIDMGKKGYKALGISLELGDKYGKDIPAYAVNAILKQNRLNRKPDAEDDTTYMNPRDAFPIDHGRSIGPTNAAVNAFKPTKGEFGFGKKTPDIYSDIDNTGLAPGKTVKDDTGKVVQRGSRAAMNKYQPTPEEAQEIVTLGKQGLQPMGISLTLADKLGKRIPVHAVASILDQHGVQHSRPNDFSVPKQDFEIDKPHTLTDDDMI